MPEEISNLAPSKLESVRLADELDYQRLDGVSEPKIQSRINDLVASVNTYPNSVHPQAPEGLDLGNIVDSSGKKQESIRGTENRLGSTATGGVVLKPEQTQISSTDNSTELPPPTLPTQL